MKSDLQKIEHWLAQNAQRIAEFSLRAPVEAGELETLEKEIGKPVPSDFRELYLWHNGLDHSENFGSLFFGIDFYPVERIIGEIKDQRKRSGGLPLRNFDPEIDGTDNSNRDWVRFGFDGSHTALYLDLAPSANGKYGQIIFVDDENEIAILVAKSTAQLVKDFVDDLENNLYFLEPDAAEDGNHYLETHASIDLVNWYRSVRWKR
jgi:cell wall assembly regulator SMI1